MDNRRMIFNAYPPVHEQHTTLRTPPQAAHLSDILAAAMDLASATWTNAKHFALER